VYLLTKLFLLWIIGLFLYRRSDEIITAFGTPKLCDAFVDHLHRLDIEILPKIQQNLSELFSVGMYADNFDMILHLIKLVSPSREDLVEILKKNKMQPYYIAAEKGHLGFVKWVLQQMAPDCDVDTMDELYKEAFGRATQFGHVQMVQHLSSLFSAKAYVDVSCSMKALKQFKHTKGDDPLKLTFSGLFEFSDVVSTLQYQICTGNNTDLEYWLANPAIAKELTKPEFLDNFRQAGNPAIIRLLDEASQRVAALALIASSKAASSQHGYFKPVITGTKLSRLPNNTKDFDDELSEHYDSERTFQ